MAEKWDVEFFDDEDELELDGSLLDYSDKTSAMKSEKKIADKSINNSNRHDRCIVHVDIDCFYAQVEMNKNPSLRDKPVGIQQKNLVVTTNYVARRAGVPKSCWIRDALKICPKLNLVNGEDLGDYRKVSQNIFDLLKTYGVPVERLGMDENYLDVTSLVEKYQDGIPSLVGHNCYENESSMECDCGCYSRLKIASKLAKDIRGSLWKELSITSSAGIAHNKLLAKMVGSRYKPNDQTILFPSDVEMFMMEVGDLNKIPGIGSSLCKTLKEKNIKTGEELQQTDIQTLVNFLELNTAQRIRDLSFGIDLSHVKQSVRPKSIGLEDRFKGLYTKEECQAKLKWLLGRLSILLHEDGRLPTVIKITARDYYKDKFIKKFHKESRQCKINSNLFDSLSTSSELSTKASLKLEAIIIQLLEKMVKTDEKFHLTLLGLSVSGFVTPKTGEISSFFKDSYSTTTNINSSCKQDEKCQQIKNAELQTRKRANPEEMQESSKKPRFEGIFESLQQPEKAPQQIDPLVLSELPKDIRNEINKSLQLNCPKLNNSYKIPNGWDKDVFNQLPHNLQQELLIQEDLEANNTSKKNKSIKGKTKTPKNILNYFHKK